MNINRHNYETFFLLYVDNELSAADRRSVELFVQENADLGNELLALLGTTLPDEKIKFNLKESLFKNEVDQELLQENLLLHLDNELDPTVSDKIKALIASDAVIANEWNILQQTKLSASDKIVFQNKNILYRHERGRVISINFWRMAAAAAVLLICLFTVISLLKNNKTGEDKIVKGTTKPSIEKQIPGNSNNIVQKNNSLDSVKTIAPENIASVDDKEKIKKENKVAPVVIKQKETQNKNEIASHDKLLNKEKNILPKSSLEKINNDESNKTNASIVLNKNNETVIKNKTPDEIAKTSIKEKITAPSAPIIDYNSVPAMPDSYAKTTALNETSPNDNKILYMNEETVSRSRIGGLFRKVKRIVERNTNIKTGNGIRVAGFEIAVK